MSATRFYFVPSQGYVRFVSGTFRSLVAYLLFIRGVLDISEDLPVSVDRMDYLLANFRLSLALEPEIKSAYLYGGVVAPRNAHEIEKANQFLMEALKVRSRDWKIPFWIGFNYVQMRDYGQAIQYYKQAAALPGSPSYLKTNLAFLYYRSGEVAEGILYLQGLMLSVDNERVRELLAGKIKWLQQIAWLEERVVEYHQKFGVWPEDLLDLQEKGLITQIPKDEFGSGFYLQKSDGSFKPSVRSRP